MNANGRENLILSIGQFRPEKDHSLQIKSFARLLKMKPKPPRDARLILLGGCRGEEDEERVEALKKLCKELNVEKRGEALRGAERRVSLSQQLTRSLRSRFALACHSSLR